MPVCALAAAVRACLAIFSVHGSLPLPPPLPRARPWPPSNSGAPPSAPQRPTDIGLQQAGLPEAVAACVAACHPALAPLLWSNVVLTGGCCRLPGLAERFGGELRSLAPDDFEVGVVAPQVRAAAAGVGGQHPSLQRRGRAARGGRTHHPQAALSLARRKAPSQLRVLLTAPPIPPPAPAIPPPPRPPRTRTCLRGRAPPALAGPSSTPPPPPRGSSTSKTDRATRGADEGRPQTAALWRGVARRAARPLSPCSWRRVAVRASGAPTPRPASLGLRSCRRQCPARPQSGVFALESTAATLPPCIRLQRLRSACG
jgi:hypothetical protein